MTRAPAIFAALTLSACANISTVVPYAPQPEIKDQAAFNADLATCRGYATGYQPGFSVSSIGNAGLQGGLGNLGGVAINPLVPVAGAAGGGGAEFMRELGLLNDAQRKVLTLCMDKKGTASGKYMILDPG